MSKKELLERISRAPAAAEPKAGAVAKRPEGGSAAAPGSPDAVTTRVSGRVVRRRARNEPGEDEPVAEAPVARRRTALDVTPAAPTREPARTEASPSVVRREAPPVRREREPEPAPSAEPEAYEPEPEAEPVAARESEPVAEPVPSAGERRGEPEPAVEPEPVAAREPEPAPEPVASAGEPEAAPEPARAERPQPPAADAGRGRGREAPAADRRAEAPRREAPARAEHAADAGRGRREGEVPGSVPERPRFEGLGKAVVAPPPGYDPTNPGAFRRRVQQQTQQAYPQRQAPPPASAAEEFMRRRGIPAPVTGEEQGGDDRRRGRRSRPTPAMQDPMSMRRRPRRKGGMVAGKGSTVEKKASKRKIRIDNVVSVGQLSHELGVKASVVIKSLMQMGRMATVNEMLDLETAALIASEFEYEVVNAGFQEADYLQHAGEEEQEEGAIERPPVVTIMGHVDHGKTTLLDAVRSAKVAAGEAGGITQHIGAYQVSLDDDRKVTFIDTPGHAAFTAMRARGAGVTDLVVLVVAADDGVQAQTEEAIQHAKAADVPIVVAVNKMDKPGVSADPIKSKLSEYGLQPEDWGGDTMYVPVSALKKQGIDELLEAILLQSEVLELRANPDRPAEGTVIEARLERGRGPVATLLVQRGTLKRGDNLVCGAVPGRIRAMMDHGGSQLKEAGPSTPVEIMGLAELPEVGDVFNVVKTEKDARTLAEHRAQEKREASLVNTGRRTAADIFAQAEAAEKKVLPIVLKADVQGSLEALKTALQNIEVAGTELRILLAAVGDISASDVNLIAADRGGLLIGFNTRVDAMARQAAEQAGVTPEIYDIIYAVIDRVKAQMSGLVAPELKEVHQGRAEIRAVFSISKFGKIAGCYITEGKVGRNHGARLFRDGTKMWEGKIATLKRFKDDVREVSSGYECGIGLEGLDDIKVGDEIETFSMEVAS